MPRLENFSPEEEFRSDAQRSTNWAMRSYTSEMGKNKSYKPSTLYYRIAIIVYYRNTVIYYPILYYGFHCCNSIAILESLVINRSKMRWSNIQFWWETSVDFLRRKKSPYFYREKVFWHINEPKKARVSIFCCCFFFPLKKNLENEDLSNICATSSIDSFLH